MNSSPARTPTSGMMFQEANLLPWRSIRKNIELPFEMQAAAPDAARIDAPAGPRRPGRVRRQDAARIVGRHAAARLHRAGAVQRPTVLLMDEPFGALDAFTRDEMNHLVEEIWLETRKTVILITHSIAEAVFLADKVYIMSARPGQISRVVDVPFARPRSLELMETREFFDLVNLIKHDIQHQPKAPNAAKGAA